MYIFDFKEKNVGLGNFIHPKDVNRILNEVLDQENENDNLLLSSEVIPIGITNLNEFIVVGYGQKNRDKIFVQNHSRQSLEEISENVFEFCKRITLTPTKLSFFENHNELYKNWGEDYWRKHE